MHRQSDGGRRPSGIVVFSGGLFVTQVLPYWKAQVLDSVAKFTAPRFSEAQDVMLR